MITTALKIVVKRVIEADTDLTPDEKQTLLAVFDTERPITYPDEALMTGAEAAQLLKVTRATICHLAKRGRITEVRRTARKVFYVRREVERMLAGLPAKERF